MSRNFGLDHHRRGNGDGRIFNPEVAPHQADGDFPYMSTPPIDAHRDANHLFRDLVTILCAALAVIGIAVIVAAAIWLASMIVALPSLARDDGRYANSPLKAWFDQLASGKGLCCSFADGVSVRNVDWDTHDGHYRVRLSGEWIDVPDTALVTEPYRFGPAVVWPYQDASGTTQIRCFLPGAGV